MSGGFFAALLLDVRVDVGVCVLAGLLEEALFVAVGFCVSGAGASAGVLDVDGGSEEGRGVALGVWVVVGFWAGEVDVAVRAHVVVCAEEGGS